MKQTEKYVKGKALAVKQNIALAYGIENDALYEKLENKGFWWNGKKKAWEKESTRPSTSIFADKKGNATGVCKYRVMCHPDETDFFVQELEHCPNLRVIEVSDDSYANRRGMGERTYVTVVRKD